MEEEEYKSVKVGVHYRDQRVKADKRRNTTSLPELTRKLLNMEKKVTGPDPTKRSKLWKYYKYTIELQYGYRHDCEDQDVMIYQEDARWWVKCYRHFMSQSYLGLDELIDLAGLPEKLNKAKVYDD